MVVGVGRRGELAKREEKRTRYHRRRQNRFGRWVQLPHPRARTAGSTGEEENDATMKKVAAVQRGAAKEEAGEDRARAAEAKAAAV